MNVSECGRHALLGAALLGGAIGFAGDGPVLDEATAAPVTLDNLELKTAATVENLVLPETWGDTNAPTVTIEGRDVGAEGTNYVWETGPYFPKQYVVTLDYGSKSYTATFDVTALAMDAWGTVDLDNVLPRVAKTNEVVALPAAWGEEPADLKLVWTDEFGAEQETALDPSQTAYGWGTGPLMPGTYGVKLVSGGGDLYATQYAVEALGASLASAAVSIDNAYDEELADGGVRNIANHTNVFKLAWVGAQESPVLSLDGEATGAAPDENGDWAWQHAGGTYAVYTFTNAVDGSNYVARFRVESDRVAVLFGGNTNDVIVAKDWYVDNVRALAPGDTRGAISDALKGEGGNGLPYWKSYVLGLGTGETLAFSSNIRAYPSGFVTTNVWDEVGQSNIVRVIATERTVEVWPEVELGAMPEGTQADVVFAFDATDSLTNAFETVKTQRNDPKLVETHGIAETNRTSRFYKTSIRVEPSLKSDE